ncbi:hypothetical protein Baya_7567 [Bagarius yarrelli]|uniref:Uncharacterized protein n=1 Tax=Bagarius yarrelli TaxID=175774 RepID=A0A556U236_BAGYA|nr:hypothetical protein Baya_7567 [Bagarius yarrelli]
MLRKAPEDLGVEREEEGARTDEKHRLIASGDESLSPQFLKILQRGHKKMSEYAQFDSNGQELEASLCRELDRN